MTKLPDWAAAEAPAKLNRAATKGKRENLRKRLCIITVGLDTETRKGLRGTVFSGLWPLRHFSIPTDRAECARWMVHRSLRSVKRESQVSKSRPWGTQIRVSAARFGQSF